MACAACHTQADETSTLRALQSQWYQDFAARDVARLTAYHASDGVVADPHGLVTGTSAIQAMWQAAAADRSTTMRGDILRVEISESRDLAYILGRYITTEVDSGTQRLKSDTGTYVSIYRKQRDGSWKIAVDINTR